MNKLQRKRGSRFFLSWIDDHLGIVFIVPAMAILALLVIYPLLFNVNMSLHKVNLLNFKTDKWEFVGLKNYIATLSDKTVLLSLLRTAAFMVITVVGQVVFGMVGALALNTKIKAKGFFTVCVLIPMMMTPIAVGLFWRILLNRQWGLVNWLLSCIGIPSVSWLSESTSAFISVCIVQIWWGVSFVILVLLGGLSSLPSEQFEAAQIDGASKWQSFIHITLPGMKSVLTTVIMLRAIDAFREFELIYTLTQGGPGAATRVFSLQLYLTSFESHNFSMGAAQAIILTLITIVLASGLIKSLGSEDSNG